MARTPPDPPSTSATGEATPWAPEPAAAGGYSDDTEARNYPRDQAEPMFRDGARKLTERMSEGGSPLPDEALREALCQRLRDDGADPAAVGLDVRAGVVVIDGPVADAKQRARWLDRIRSVGGVIDVDCRLQLTGD